MAQPEVTHRAGLFEHGMCKTRCGIRLSDTDTSRTYYDTPIHVTYFDARTTCEFCLNPKSRPQLRSVQ